MISNIVFTKNRPLQLEAYLESLYKHFPQELIQTYIIYKVDMFHNEYEQVFKKFTGCIVVQEKDYHSDFLSIIKHIETKYILFGVDDVVFFNSIDLNIINETFDKNEENIFGFSLRFGQEIIENSRDIVNKTLAGGQTVFYLDWTKGQTPNTRYPFELCATVYHAKLVREIIKSSINNNPLAVKLFSPRSVLIKVLKRFNAARKVLKRFGYFYSPNTLESWVCRWCRNHSEQIAKYLYFKKFCASAIQVNMVNTSTDNAHEGTDEYTVENLNNKYKQGYRLDIDYINKNKPTTTHIGQEYFKLKQL